MYIVRHARSFKRGRRITDGEEGAAAYEPYRQAHCEKLLIRNKLVKAGFKAEITACFKENGTAQP